MKKIYVAGKYDDTNVINVLNNIRAGIELSVKILKQGDIPFCPFLDFLFVLIGDSKGLVQTHFRDYSIEWLKVCDEIWFLPSWTTSGGCKAEKEVAERLGIKIRFVHPERDS